VQRTLSRASARNAVNGRLKSLKLLILLWLTCLVWAETPRKKADNVKVAAILVRMATKAQNSGQVVRAYLLFSEAVTRDPKSSSYRSKRDALAPAARLFTTAKIQNPSIANDVLTAENEAANPEPPIEHTSTIDWQSQPALQPIPEVHASKAKRDFDLRAPATSLFSQIANAYGVQGLVDRDVPASSAPIHFEIAGADFHAALEALTAATHTFVFPINSSTIYFAPDTEVKRNELEPVVVLTFPLQEALTERDLIDVANAVRGLLRLRTMGWDSFNRMVVIRDRASRARVARALMEALLLPRAQVSFDVEFLTVDTDKNYHYGLSLQTLYQFVDFGRLGGFQTVLPQIIGSSSFGTFGGGATLFGVGIADAMAFASYSNSFASSIFDATVVVGDRQTADFHIGDKYPIATSLYTGFSASLPSIYNPAPQITMEDLGLVLKMTPHITGEGNIDVDLEANFKSLGSQTFNTVPEISERGFKGRINIHEGEWAIIAGLNSSAYTFTRTGLAGIGQIPGIKQLLSETTRDTQTSDVLLVIKPTITRLPMTEEINPQYLVGSTRGERVVL
jgi:general secretion pathway protein D